LWVRPRRGRGLDLLEEGGLSEAKGA
jgi:hypothetical protein